MAKSTKSAKKRVEVNDLAADEEPLTEKERKQVEGGQSLPAARKKRITSDNVMTFDEVKR